MCSRIPSPDARLHTCDRGSNAALRRVVRGSIMEGDMHQVDDDNDSPPPPPDPLTVIFEWLESADDAHEDAPQAPTVQCPAPQGQAQTVAR